MFAPRLACVRWSIALLPLFAASGGAAEELFKEVLNVTIPHVSTDKSVKYDYDIVYVRAGRAGDEKHKRYYTDFSQPVTMEGGADLMLLHPNGEEELLVPGGEGSITDTVVSFDGQWVYYVHLYNLAKRDQWTPDSAGSDIFKVHVKSRKVVRLTNQVFTPNLGAADWTDNFRGTPGKDNQKTHLAYGVFNMGPHPLPGGKIVFTSNRDGFKPAKGYPAICLQLFVMDDADENVGEQDAAPGNIEKIGHLNLAGALHPVTLKDGRIMFSSLESQGNRSDISWGLWTINPDGTNWNPLVSAFDPGGASNGFHFQTQLTDGRIVFEEYYNQNNSGFGAYFIMPPTPPDGYAGFGPANMSDPRNKPWRSGRFDNGKGKYYRMPFMPTGSEALTPFALNAEGPADPSILGDKNSQKVGKFTHPSGAPHNDLLTIYSPGPVNHQYTYLPQLDGGIYLIKGGKTVTEPAQMLLIKNDPNYNESWPRAVVSYERIYGQREPALLPRIANDGKQSKHLPAGTPFGLVGSSSLYKRESYPNGVVSAKSVTATFAGGNDPWKGLDPFTSHGYGMSLNWHNQGGDVGLYSNDDIHALRVLAMEPTTDRSRGAKSGRLFHNHAQERLRVLGEIPVRKFTKEGKQPLDPDGNPDTSFLVKIPADVPFTFQTLDRHGMVLNSSQTWHQLRPGEIRHNCGGCHAHSQAPTDFSLTAAAKEDYRVWDLTERRPLLTDLSKDESKQPWDTQKTTGLLYETGGIASVEYHRDVRPILQRSCVACHTEKEGREPAGQLNLDADHEEVAIENRGKFPGTYVRLALDERAKFGIRPASYDSWGYPNASRYVRKFQARRSLLTWKIFGERLDGFTNDDHPSEPEPGAGFLVHKGERTDKQKQYYDLDFVGSQMPPPDAVAGKAKGPDGQTIKVAPLSDEDRRTLVRWIDLGCPIDKDYRADQPQERGYGWMCDDLRPTLTIEEPRSGANSQVTRILIGKHDFYSGLDDKSFSVTADFPIGEHAAGTNLAPRGKTPSPGVWELSLEKPLGKTAHGRLTVSVKDRQGNESRIVRTFSVGK